MHAQTKEQISISQNKEKPQKTMTSVKNGFNSPLSLNTR